MSKKHFEAAAAYVRQHRRDGLSGADEIEAAFAALFRQFNERFRDEQFRCACRGEDYEGSTYSGRPLTRRYSRG